MIELVKNFNKLAVSHYAMLKKNLTAITSEELDWQPHPEANTVRWIIGHLRWFEDWVPDAIETRGRYGKDKGPQAYPFDDLEHLFVDFDQANERRTKVYKSLSKPDLKREVDYFGAYHVSLEKLIRTHAGHMAGHRYQIRYIRAMYSRVNRTDKAVFDPW